jgi:hypothetical protein
MNVSDVERVLAALHAPDRYFVLGYEEGAWCLFQESGSWVTCFVDRSTRSGEKKFKTQDAACRYFLKKVIDQAEAILPE